MEGDNIVDVADKLGLHHETVRRHVLFLRERFLEKGLHPWSD
jgi:predicted ArsR family transcriptional regulator